MSRVPKLRNSGIEEKVAKCKKLILGLYLKGKNFKTIKDSCDKIINKVCFQWLMQLYQ